MIASVIGSLVHSSYLDQLPTATIILWVAVAGLCFGLGVRVFRHMAFLPAKWRRGPWYMIAYGMTGYATAKIGWLFDDINMADRFWSPLAYFCGIAAVVGAILTFECLFKHIRRMRDHPECRYPRDTADP